MVMSAKNREKIANQRRAAILNAAIAEFDDHGFENTKITDIAKSAGVSAGLIYHYFGSKVDILKSYGSMITNCQNYVLGLKTPLDSLKAFCRRVLLPYSETNYHSPIRIIISCYANGSLKDANEIFPFTSYGKTFLGQIIKKGQAAGQFRAGDPAMMGDVIWHTVIGYIIHRYNYHQALSSDIIGPILDTVTK